MKNVTFAIHLDPAEHDVVWWAEADALPGLSVAASTLRELRTLIDEAVRLHVGDGVEISLDLVPDEPQSSPDESGFRANAPSAVSGSHTPAVRLATTPLRHAA